MKTSFQLLIIIIILTWSKSVFSQESWTLDDCVSYALEHNIQLKDFKYVKDSGEEIYRQSIRDLLPKVKGESSYSIRYGRSTDPFTNDIVNSDFFNNNYSLQASMDIFQGFQKINSVKATNLLYKAAIEDLQQQKYLLAFRVMIAYYDIKFYEGLLSNTIDQVKISQNNYGLVQRQINLGLKAVSDLHEAEAIRLSDQLMVTQSKNFLTAAKLTLIQEMNLQDITDITLQDDMKTQEISNQNINTDSIFAIAKSFVPLLKAQEFRAKAADRDLAVARGKLFPLVSVFSGFGTGYYETTVDTLGSVVPLENQFKNNASHYIGVSITIPILNGWSGRSRIKQQTINLSREQNNIVSQGQELFKIIQQLVQEFKALQMEVRQSNKKVEAQELAFTIAQKKYEKGLINVLDLFQVKNLFGTAQNENLQARLQLKVTKKKLDFYSGLPVFNIE